jgi:hypothetical protein
MWRIVGDMSSRSPRWMAQLIALMLMMFR